MRPCYSPPVRGLGSPTRTLGAHYDPHRNAFDAIRLGLSTLVSYGMYVFGYPVQQMLVHRLGPTTSVPVLFGCTVVITLVLAIASWHFIEAPALALKRTLPDRSAR